MSNPAADANFYTDKHMTYKFNHFNFNVTNLAKSLEFYDKALGLKETHRIEGNDDLAGLLLTSSSYRI